MSQMAVIDWLLRAADAPAPRHAPVTRVLDVAGRDLPLTIRRLRSARQMTLRLAPDGREARITMPVRGRIADAEKFAQDRRDWLARQIAALPAAEPPRPGGTLRYRGGELVIRHDAAAGRKPILADATITLGGPLTNVPARLQRWLESEALQLAAADLAEYCTRAGVTPPDLRLSRAQRRWGSCTSKGTVRINWRLVMAPDAVRRSVVAHEVAHLIHFDHSRAFHALLDSIFESSLAEANLWLKREGRGLYLPFG